LFGEGAECSTQGAFALQHFLGVTVQPMIRRDGYELILGSSVDPQFGPVLLFGAGGQLVEVFRDRALGLPPLNATLARRLMEQTRIYTALQGVRGRPPVDLAALENLLVRFSQLVAQQRWIKEIDINPLLVQPNGSRFSHAIELRNSPTANLLPLPARHERGEGWGEGNLQQKRSSSPGPSPPSDGREGGVSALSTLSFLNSTSASPLSPGEPCEGERDGARSRQFPILALDARIVLHDPATLEKQLPRPAIRPYPTRYVARWKLKNGTLVTVRPIRPEDEPLMVKFHQTLSERSVYLRYFTALRVEQRIAHERLARLCFIDYDREMALVVERKDAKTDARQILGVGRLSKLHGTDDAEFALTVSDQWQNQGLGTQLLKMLVQVGRDERLSRITATILPDNHEMQHVCRKVGFEVRHVADEGECQAEIVL
jgi:acetyltransferase